MFPNNLNTWFWFRGILLRGIFTMLLFGTGNSAALQEMTTALQVTQGSIPPVDGPFQCVTELDGKSYSELLVQNCLEHIRKLSYVLDAQTESKNLPNGGLFVEFIVRAKELRVNELNFAVPAEDSAQLERWLNRNPNNLRLGATYTPKAESSTYQGIKQFYLARGTLVGIVPSVHLYYSEGKARLTFEVIRGPEVFQSPAYFPYGDACDDEIKSVDWSGADDFVPVPLAESVARLRSTGVCFNAELVTQDREALRNLAAFRKSDVNYSGGRGARQISFKLAGKPLTMTEVNIRNFGPYATCAGAAKQHLSLQPGQIYSAASARRDGEYLHKVCSGPGRWVEVSEKDELTEAGSLRVFLDVLTFPLQTVFVDNAEIR